MLFSHKIESLNPLGFISSQTEKLSQDSLIDLLKKADQTAQRLFYKEYFGKMMGIAMRYTSDKDDAHAVINTAFYKVFKSILSYKSQGSFDGWVAVIVKRTAIDHCRKSTFQYRELDTLPETKEPSSNQALNNLAVEDIYACIQQLPSASRTVFNMFAIEGYKHDEIASELNISVGTSKWHVSNARKILQNLIKELK